MGYAYVLAFSFWLENTESELTLRLVLFFSPNFHKNTGRLTVALAKARARIQVRHEQAAARIQRLFRGWAVRRVTTKLIQARSLTSAPFRAL